MFQDLFSATNCVFVVFCEKSPLVCAVYCPMLCPENNCNGAHRCAGSAPRRSGAPYTHFAYLYSACTRVVQPRRSTGLQSQAHLSAVVHPRAGESECDPRAIKRHLLTAPSNEKAAVDIYPHKDSDLRQVSMWLYRSPVCAEAAASCGLSCFAVGSFYGAKPKLAGNSVLKDLNELNSTSASFQTVHNTALRTKIPFVARPMRQSMSSKLPLSS